MADDRWLLTQRSFNPPAGTEHTGRYIPVGQPHCPRNTCGRGRLLKRLRYGTLSTRLRLPMSERVCPAATYADSQSALTR